MEKIGRIPDYKGDGVAIWKNLDKNKKPYLSVKILSGLTVNCFKNEPKPTAKLEETAEPSEIQI